MNEKLIMALEDEIQNLKTSKNKKNRKRKKKKSD